MATRINPDAEQKDAILNMFRGSKYMSRLTDRFIKSFKLMEIRNDDYVFWSEMLGKTLKVPLEEIE